MTMMSDLSQDLVEEILCRVPKISLGAVRCTCKGWNTLSKTRILCKSEAKHQILGFTLMDHRLFSMRFNLHGISNEDAEEFVDPSMKPIYNILNQVKISGIYYCDGLLFCLQRNNSRLLVWNPYLGQTRWIQLRRDYRESMYAVGYDNNKNHKILSFFYQDDYYEIYDLKSNSWSSIDVTLNREMDCYSHVTLNGNTYFLAKKRDIEEEEDICFLISFDFTKERFGEIMTLPFSHCYWDTTVVLSCVKEEKLAVLYQPDYTYVIEIWMTTKIEPNDASWSNFLRVDMKALTAFDFQFHDKDTFFIDEEKKVTVVFNFEESEKSTAYIIGENRYLKIVDLEKIVNLQESEKLEEHQYGFSPLVCFCSYVPSLVQINHIAECKSMGKKRKHKGKKRRRSETTRLNSIWQWQGKKTTFDY